MPFVAPWTLPPDFLGYTRGGAEAGLAASRTRQAADEAADRTRLGYAQLASQQNEAMARIAAAREAQAINAAESLRSHRALEAYRGTEEQNRLFGQQAEQAAQALRERHQGFLEQQASLPTGEKTLHIGNKVVALQPDGSAKVLFDADADKLNPAEKAKLGQMLKVDTGFANQQAKLQSDYQAKARLLKSGEEETEDMKAIRDLQLTTERQREGLQNQIKSLTPAQAAQSLTQPAVDPNRRTPFIYQGTKEGEYQNPAIPGLIQTQSGGFLMSKDFPTASGLPSPVTNGLQIGEIRKGYRYKGGDPADKNSWEKVQ